jgi:hypothetical protein
MKHSLRYFIWETFISGNGMFPIPWSPMGQQDLDKPPVPAGKVNGAETMDDLKRIGIGVANNTFDTVQTF